MKVIQIVKTSDGAKWAFDQAKWLHENGIEIVTILPSFEGRMVKNYVDNNMKIIEGDFSLPLTKPWKIFKRKKELEKIIKKEKPDLIHFHFVTNILFARLCLRNDRTLRLFQVPGPLHLENKLIRKIEILLSKDNDYWAPSCKYSKSIYDKYIDSNRVFLAYYGGYGGEAIKQYKNSNILHKEYNISNDKLLIGMVSYFYKPKYYIGQTRGIKGHEDFIDAISILNQKYDNILAFVVGGPWGNSIKYQEKVKRYAKKRKVENIIFTGFRNDIKKIYREFNIAVHPSHSENLGGAAESLAAGVPTVSTNIGGFPDIVINDNTGITCKSKSPSELATKIDAMLTNPTLATKMAKEGQKLIESLLDINNTSKKMKEIYETITSKDGD